MSLDSLGGAGGCDSFLCLVGISVEARVVCSSVNSMFAVLGELFIHSLGVVMCVCLVCWVCGMLNSFFLELKPVCFRSCFKKNRTKNGRKSAPGSVNFV